MAGPIWQSIFVVLFLVYHIHGHDPESEYTPRVSEIEDFHNEELKTGAGVDVAEGTRNAIYRKRPAYCYLPADKGACGPGVFTRYHYDYKTNTCRSFLYSGCGGNKNKFHRWYDCREICKAY